MNTGQTNKIRVDKFLGVVSRQNDRLQSVTSQDNPPRRVNLEGEEVVSLGEEVFVDAETGAGGCEGFTIRRRRRV